MAKETKPPETPETTISNKEDLINIHATIVQNSDKHIRLGLSQIVGDPNISVKEEADRLREEARNSRGTLCRCCGQKVQLYKRTLTAEMGVCLLYMLKFFRHSEKAEELQYYTKQDFFSEVINDKNLKHILFDFTKLKYWDLIAPMPTNPDKVMYKKGYWTLTENGIKFAQREIGIPKYAYIYNDQVDSHSSGETFVTIDDLLKLADVTYEEIML